MNKLMKTCMLSAFAMAFAGYACAQNALREQDLVKKIEVYGNAEKKITPNQIYFAIALKEYMENDKNKVSIDKLERDLYSAVRRIGVREEDFQIMDVASYNYDVYRKKKKEREEFLASKQYRITFKDLNDINRLFESLDPKGIQSTNIAGYSHSDLERMKRELKIEAIKDAQDKAQYLLSGIRENLGEVMEIQDINNDYQPPVYYAKAMRMAEDAMAEEPLNIDFQEIKIQAQVRAVFRIR